MFAFGLALVGILDPYLGNRRHRVVSLRKVGTAMRINVYSQELTNETKELQKTSNTGLVYSAVQMILHSSERLHHPPADDDRSAITFWLPKSKGRREALARTFERLADKVRQAAPETGLD